MNIWKIKLKKYIAIKKRDMVISILRKEEMVISDYGKIVGLVPGHDFMPINKRFG